MDAGDHSSTCGTWNAHGAPSILSGPEKIKDIKEPMPPTSS